jgi:hypothetical protein
MLCELAAFARKRGVHESRTAMVMGTLLLFAAYG